jgi:hypothetical protein
MYSQFRPQVLDSATVPQDVLLVPQGGVSRTFEGKP